VKDGKAEFPPLDETMQRVWTVYKLLHPERRDGDPDVEYWLHWVHRAELSALTLFAARHRRFPASPEEFEDELAGEILIQAKAKANAAGCDFVWSREEGWRFRYAGSDAIIHLQGPVANPHPFAGTT